MRNGDAAELALLLEVGRLADAVLPARLGHLGAEFDLFQDTDDLAFTELRFLYVETPFGGILYSRLDQVFEEASFRVAIRDALDF